MVLKECPENSEENKTFPMLGNEGRLNGAGDLHEVCTHTVNIESFILSAMPLWHCLLLVIFSF